MTPACYVTAPKASNPTGEGEAEASVINGPALLGGLEINAKCMAMIIYYVNE